MNICLAQEKIQTLVDIVHPDSSVRIYAILASAKLLAVEVSRHILDFC